ncbi:MAG TPA: hypothetical protein VHC18_26790 [Amycolatopsis sp.]|nr:hypothetical protein [Amycolatopsis sp.]
MVTLLWGIVFALLAACCYATAAGLQHRVVSEGTRELRWLARQPRWLLGLAAQAVGGALHVAALVAAPLVVVQPLNASAIGLTVLASVVVGGARPDRTTVVAVLTTMAGVATFVVFAARAAVHVGISAHAQGRLMVLAAVATAVVIMAARAARGRSRGPVFALAAGVCFGLASALVRSVVDGAGGWALPALGIAIAVTLGLWCVQQGYAHGRPETVVACQTVADPLVGVAVGACLLGEFPHADGLTLCGAFAGAVLTVTGVVLLARRRVSRATLAY